ncbi:uncharacterized protein A4U43_C06F6620 [Asparagus officinalis]|uniref:BED-type domain-containing protein n=1 Tax=Asparagus officinalis TaxID=4686 RepID=A0A5P1EQM5_ASPOF|nr:uncharacterized protein LOC109844444 [Asparagus officinalis]XP_020269068.1 uncharacterized protein LOC109844444 [Asparagus officinalis]XP_020269069.1 uncharacterized protein LOC109844444 [Asparagus officinalis]XP_020269070.1 uncharacterized protein LOC109844444 [Asparagus officinalis]XP_020269071.1 uncharacterized protein LOC109844444 [Asparagus officinalis]ONK66330.1 uncharacterized protein A4U43_C06F6620 [Asparagus officinalis]
MPRNKDVLWEHIVQDGRKVRCKFCHEVFVGGVTRMRYHFANTCSKDIRPCKAVPASVRDAALKGVEELEMKSKKRKNMRFSQSGDSALGSILQCGDAHNNESQVIKPKSKSIHLSTRMPAKKEADMAIVKYIVNSNLPFDILSNSDFREACIAVANAGPGYEPPSSENTCRKLLTELMDEADKYVHAVERIWEKSGCTLMLNSWIEGRDTSYLHIFAASAKGVVYLKSLCMVGRLMDDQYVFDFISSVIDEIGSQNVVQFISHSQHYKSIGHMIEGKYPNIFIVNCATHIIILMLKDFEALQHVSPILETAKRIIHFVYKHQHVLNLMRTHTNGSLLRRPAATRLWMNFIYLQSLLKLEHALRHIIGTIEWRDSMPCKSAEGIEVQNMIEDASFWDCAKELMYAVEPLIKTLRVVDRGGSTSGYIYDAIRKAKETIKEIYGNESKYMNFWKIIDDKWNNFLYSDIHAAAAYLNPHLFHDGRVKLDSGVRIGLEKVIQKMVSNNEERMKIAEELRDYHSLDPRIFGLMAVDSLHVSHPRIWWDMWGSSVPVLQNLAIKVLSQPCSFLTAEKNWTAPGATKMSMRDHLESTRLQDLLYVRMNIHLMKTTAKMEKIDLKPIDVDKIEISPDELEEIGDLEYENEEEADESENEAGNLSDTNGFSFSGIV